MLSPAQISAGRRSTHPQPSLKQQYQEYVLQRIEGYKNSLPREEILRLGEEATAELQSATEGQFVLTEVLMLETVDRLIARRLGIGSYSRWRRKFQRLRAAQREPTHWGIDNHHPVVTLLPRVEPEDRVLAIGGGAEPCVCLLSAHEAEVTFVAGSLGAVERIESRIASESLASRFLAYVAQLGEWLPPLDQVCLVIVDGSALAELPASMRRRLLADLQHITAPEGVHLLLPGETGVAPEGFLSHYPSWQRASAPARPETRGGGTRGLLLTRPPDLRTPESTPEDIFFAQGG